MKISLYRGIRNYVVSTRKNCDGDVDICKVHFWRLHLIEIKKKHIYIRLTLVGSLHGRQLYHYSDLLIASKKEKCCLKFTVINSVERFNFVD